MVFQFHSTLQKHSLAKLCMRAFAILGFTILALYIGRVTQSWFFGLAALICPPVLLSLRITHTMAVAVMAVFWAFVFFGVGGKVAGPAFGLFFGAVGGALGVAVNAAFAGFITIFRARYDSTNPMAQRVELVKDPDYELRRALQIEPEGKPSEYNYAAFVGLIAFAVFALTLFVTAHQIATFDVSKQNAASFEPSRVVQSDFNNHDREMDNVERQLDIAEAHIEFGTAIIKGGTIREWQASSSIAKIVWAESWAKTFFKSQGRIIDDANARLLGLKIASCVNAELQEMPDIQHIKAAEIGAMCITKLLA